MWGGLYYFFKPVSQEEPKSDALGMPWRADKDLDLAGKY